MFSWILVFLHALRTKQEYIITACIPKYMYDHKHIWLNVLPFTFYLRTLLPALKHWKILIFFAGDILVINNLLTKSWLIKWLNIYNKIIFTY